MNPKPLRVLLVTEDIPATHVGGLGKHVVTLGNALLRQGHEVALLGRSDVDYESARAEIGFEGHFIPGFHFKRHGWKEASLGVWLPFKRRHLAKRIERAIRNVSSGFDVVHYHGHLPMVGLGLPADLPLLQTRHDQGSECLLHTRFVNGRVCRELSPAACAECATANPNAVQRFISTAGVAQYRNQIEANCTRRPTIFVSAFLQSQYSAMRPNADCSRNEVVHNFIQFDRLQALSRGVLPEQGSVFLAGRIDEPKGFSEFLNAWSIGGSPGRLRIAGDGPDLRKLQGRYGHTVDFLGWQQYDSIVVETARAQVCVVPSIWEEAFGTTTAEALVLGRPCLALRRGGTPELARYQRYEGQLQLFDSMGALVQGLQVELERPLRMLPELERCDADVQAVLPAILRAYDRTRSFALGDART